jgi:PTH1 family peptidyl-tRNA hydrolase
VNLSGIVVGALARAHDLAPEAIFVVVDDLDLPLGRMRIRSTGSSGGHRGLVSIEQVLGTDHYPRLRLGIGRPAGGASEADWVLSRFGPQQQVTVERVRQQAAQAVQEWTAGTCLETLMGRYNGLDLSGLDLSGLDLSGLDPSGGVDLSERPQP